MRSGRLRIVLAAAGGLVLLVPAVLVAAVGAETLVGSVGPGFTISLKKADGTRVLNLDPGEYTLDVDDQGEVHSFHLRGPGVDVKTGIEAIGPERFDVRLANGSYSFFCDVHPDQMKGSFTVGSGVTPPPPPPPPPLPKLFGTVVKTITLKNAAGIRVKTVKAGTYVVVVKDLSSAQNFHLTGTGVNRKTSVAGRGTFTWRVRFVKGKVYTYRSDARPTLRGTFKAT